MIRFRWIHGEDVINRSTSDEKQMTKIVNKSRLVAYKYMLKFVQLWFELGRNVKFSKKETDIVFTRSIKIEIYEEEHHIRSRFRRAMEVASVPCTQRIRDLTFLLPRNRKKFLIHV